MPQTVQCGTRLSLDNNISAFAVGSGSNPNYVLVASSLKKEYLLWDFTLDNLVSGPWKYTSNSYTFFLSFSPLPSSSASHFLAIEKVGITDMERYLKIYSIEGGEDGTLNLKAGPFRHDWASTAAFSPNGTSIASASHDGVVKVWNLSTKSLTCQCAFPMGPYNMGSISSISYSPTGSHLLLPVSNTPGYVVDSKTLRPVKSFQPTYIFSSRSARFTSDGTHVVAGIVGHSSSQSRGIGLLDSLSGELKYGPFLPKCSSTNQLEISPDCQHAAVEAGGRINIMDIKTGEVVLAFQHCRGGEVVGMEFSRSATHLVYRGGSNRSLYVYDLSKTLY